MHNNAVPRNIPTISQDVHFAIIICPIEQAFPSTTQHSSCGAICRTHAGAVRCTAHVRVHRIVVISGYMEEFR